MDGTQVGKISKQWSGLAREYFTDADHFGISFPLDLDVKMKAVMLGACFLIVIYFFLCRFFKKNFLKKTLIFFQDAMFFENNAGNKNES